jgi:hypothetical protein
MSENPFLGLAEWDTVKTGVPVGKSQVAVIKDSGVRIPEYQKNGVTTQGGPQVYFDLYFPEHGCNHVATFAIMGHEVVLRILKGNLEKLGLATGKGSAATMPQEIENTRGWTVNVDVYESEDKKDSSKKYKNVRFNSVIEKTLPEIPF